MSSGPRKANRKTISQMIEAIDFIINASINIGDQYITYFPNWEEPFKLGVENLTLMREFYQSMLDTI